MSALFGDAGTSSITHAFIAGDLSPMSSCDSDHSPAVMRTNDRMKIASAFMALSLGTRSSSTRSFLRSGLFSWGVPKRDHRPDTSCKSSASLPGGNPVEIYF